MNFAVIRIYSMVTCCCRVFAGLLLLQHAAVAQDFQTRNWGVENGLSDSSVTAIAQTADGYLWVGTPKGLNRFDGNSFTRVDTAGGSL